MAKTCDFCGKQLGWGEGQYKNLKEGSNEARLCDNCFSQFRNLPNTNDKIKTKNSVCWAKEILDKNKFNKDLYNDFCEQIAFAEEIMETLPEVEIVTENKHKPEQKSLIENNITSQVFTNNINKIKENVNKIRESDNSNKIKETIFPEMVNNFNNSSTWTGILKIVAVVLIVAMSITGIAVGAMIGDAGAMPVFGAFVGLILGLLVGFVSASVIMIFVGMAEDIKATREYARQIRNMMNDNNK